MPKPDESSSTPSALPPQLIRWRAALYTRRGRVAGAAVVILATVVAAYSNTFFSAIQSDERPLIASALAGAGNPSLSPLGALSLGIEARMFGFSAFGYRVTSVVWHLLASLGVYFVVSRLVSAGAFGWLVAVLAAVIFAAHPAATHAVNTLTVRGNLMATALVLGAIALVLRNPGDGRRTMPVHVAAVCALLALAWSANPAVALVAPMLPALEFASRRRIAWAIHAPAIALLILLTLLHGLAGHAAAVHSDHNTVPVLRAAFAPVSLLVYHAPSVQNGGVLVWLAAIAIGAIAFAIRPALGVGVLWLALAARFSGADPADGGFNEGQLHLALVGVSLLAAFLIDYPRTASARGIVVLPVLLAILGAVGLTSSRNNLWRSEAALWIQASEACPTCAEPQDRLGRLHFMQATQDIGDAGTVPGQLPEEVRGHLQHVIDLLEAADAGGTASVETAIMRATALRLLGRPEDSQRVLDSAAARWPANGALMVARAEWYGADPASGPEGARRAVRRFRAAERRSALNAPSRVGNAVALGRVGNWTDAAALLRGVSTENDPVASALAGEAAARVRASQSALTSYIQSAGAATLQARAASKARVLDAQAHYQLAAQIAHDAYRRYPSSLELWTAVGIAEIRLGRFEQFVREPGLPVPIDPSTAWDSLARELGMRSDWIVAEQVYRQALSMSEYDAAMRLVTIAREIDRANIASIYLRRATQLAPSLPEPWLALAEIAIDAGQADAAREAIAGAEQRGAAGDVLNSLKARAGIAPGETQEPRRTIIR